MRGVFDDEENDQPKPGSDAEFTLGFGTMLLLFAGLVVVCGVCFGLGYMAGRRGTTVAASQQSAPNQANFPVGGFQPKPSATSQPVAPVPAASQPSSTPQPASSDLPQSTASVAIPMVSPQSSPQVRPALPVTGNVAKPATTYPSLPATNGTQPQVRPASMPPIVPLWVQIAAVSHAEDADVLANALRKRGYTVTSRRETDNLIHVRIGPFSTRDEAGRWRTKLLDDGYNAQIQ